jgi:dCTP deaminase
MLSDSQIGHATRWQGLHISAFNPEQLQPSSYDIRLHPQLLVLKAGDEPLDPRQDTTDQWTEVYIDQREGFLLRQGDFALGSTLERFEMGPQLTGQLEGKSSLGRLGLSVHSTAGYLDPGFTGQVTLELSCVHPRGVILYPGMRIGQVAFDTCVDVKQLYEGKYQHQVGPTSSRYHENWTGERWL